MHKRINSKTEKTEFSRRSFLEKSATLSMGVPFLGLGMLPSADSSLLNATKEKLSDKDKFQTYVRLIGSLESTTIYNWFSGHLWGIVPGEAPKPLVTFQGLAKSIWELKGESLSKQSFDIGFFGDLETGEILSEFTNPYSGKTVHPYHYMYGGGTKTFYSKEGITSGGQLKPYETNWMQSGDQIWLDEFFLGSFENPFKPEEWPKSSAGKNLNYGSSTTYIANATQLFDSKKMTCPHQFFWTSINSWEPWLHMGQAPGFVMWRATGRKIFDVNEIPEKMKTYIKKTQPNYFGKGAPWEGRRSTMLSYMEKYKSDKK